MTEPQTAKEIIDAAQIELNDLIGAYRQRLNVLETDIITRDSIIVGLARERDAALVAAAGTGPAIDITPAKKGGTRKRT